jgi:LysR family transcriptional regulator, glycine cleavage system transcriptional activator
MRPSLRGNFQVAQRHMIIGTMSQTHTPDMLRGIPLEALRGFELAARLLNYTRASIELSVTQSAVSREISTLEGRLGVRLFERVNGALRLTAAGVILQKEVQVALSTLRRALERASSSAGRQTLVVSVNRPLGAEWLSRILPAFLDANPGLDVRLVMQARSSATTDWMGIEEPVPPDVNVSLRLLPRAAAGERLKLLIPEFVYPCCTRELGSETGREITEIADLSRHRLIEYDDGMPGLELLDASWSNWFAAAGTIPVIAQQWVRVPDWSAIIMLALSGAGVFLGRSPLVHSYLREGSLVRCTRAIVPSTRAYFVSRSGPGESDASADLFIDWLHSEAAREQEVPPALPQH